MGMLSNQTLPRIFVKGLILLSIIGFVLTPPVLSGYTELQKAESAMNSQDFILSVDHYERARILLPWRADLWNLAGIASFGAGDCDGSVGFLETARVKGVLSDSGWDVLGICYYETGNLIAAIKTWEAALEIYPNYSKYYWRLAYVYRKQENLSEEQTAIEQWLLKDGATDAGAHFRLGILLSIYESERALEQFHLASSLDSLYDPPADTMRTTLNLASIEKDGSGKYVIVGRGLGLIDEWELAANAFRLATQIDKKNAEAWAWLGEAEQHLDGDGRAELDKALSLDRANPIIRSLRGLYWNRQGRPKQALAEYLLAAEYDPQNPAWQISIAEAYVQNGDLLKAFERYLRATELAPTDVTAWHSLAVFCIQYGVQIEEIGLPAAQMAVDLSGDDPPILVTLGQVLTRLGHFDEAQDVLERALDLDPSSAQANLHLGILAIHVEDWGRAKDYLQRAYDLDGVSNAGEQAQVLLNQYFP